jgi:peptide/nickel transport system permease protein
MTGLRALWDGIWQHPSARLGVLLVGAFVLVATVGPWFVQDPMAFQATPLQPPSWAHWFGTTGQGQDVLAQTVCGARPTLIVAGAVGVTVVVFGALIGGLAGFVGGRFDDAASLAINVTLVLPGLPLMVVLAAWLPPGPASIWGVLVLTGWAWNARVIRAATLSLRDRDFVHAAVISGESSLRIVAVEILPNLLSLLTSSFIAATVHAIGAQVGLEFLGLGDVGVVTWGTNLYWAANDAALLTGSWWTFVPTGLGVALVGFGLTLVNYGVDEQTNPRLRSERLWQALLGSRLATVDRTPYAPHLRPADEL